MRVTIERLYDYKNVSYTLYIMIYEGIRCSYKYYKFYSKQCIDVYRQMYIIIQFPE